jgi:hypothetical protein
VGLCLADGTPIAITMTRNCAGAVTSEGWVNLRTGTYTTGTPPVGTVSCAGSASGQSVQTTGTFCDILPDQTVAGLVLVEYHYNADGTISSVRLVNAVTGATYTPQGTITTCPVGVEAPESDMTQLCDVQANGTSIPFVRDYRRDETGAITGHTDYTLAGAPYAVQGTVGICQPDCQTTAVQTVQLCDLNPNVTPNEDGLRCATQFLRHYVYDCAGVASFHDTTMDGVTPYNPVQVTDCGDAAPSLREQVWNTLSVAPEAGDSTGTRFTYTVANSENPNETGTVTLVASHAFGSPCTSTPDAPVWNGPVEFTFIPDANVTNLASVLRVDMVDWDTWEDKYIPAGNAPNGQPWPVPYKVEASNGFSVPSTNRWHSLADNSTGSFYFAASAGQLSQIRIGNRNDGGGVACIAPAFGFITLVPGPPCTVTSSCVTCVTDELCDTFASSTVTSVTNGQTSGNTSGGINWTSTGGSSGGDRPGWWSAQIFPGAATGPLTFTFNKAVTVTFSASVGRQLGSVAGATLVMPPGTRIRSLNAMHNYDPETRTLTGRAGSDASNPSQISLFETTVASTTLSFNWPSPTNSGERMIGDIVVAPETIRFNRITCRDCDGVARPPIDLTLAGAPYTPTGTIGKCDLLEKSACYHCTTETICAHTTVNPAELFGGDGHFATGLGNWVVSNGAAYTSTVNGPDGQPGVIAYNLSTSATGGIADRPMNLFAGHTYQLTGRFGVTSTGIGGTALTTALVEVLDPTGAVVPGTSLTVTPTYTVNGGVQWNTSGQFTVTFDATKTGSHTFRFVDTTPGTTVATALLLDNVDLHNIETDQESFLHVTCQDCDGFTVSETFTSLTSGQTTTVDRIGACRSECNNCEPTALCGYPAVDTTERVKSGTFTGHITTGWTLTGNIITDDTINGPNGQPGVLSFDSADTVPNGVATQAITVTPCHTYRFRTRVGVQAFNGAGTASKLLIEVLRASGEVAYSNLVTIPYIANNTVQWMDSGTIDTVLKASDSTFTIRITDKSDGGAISVNALIDDVSMIENETCLISFVRTDCRNCDGVVQSTTDVNATTGEPVDIATVVPCGVTCQPTQVCTAPAEVGEVQFVSNPDKLNDGSVEATWKWTPVGSLTDPSQATTWYPMYRKTFPGGAWVTVDSPTRSDGTVNSPTAGWISTHPDAHITNTGQPGEGPTLVDPSLWWARTQFTLPVDADPSSIRVEVTALNADQVPNRYRLNNGPWIAGGGQFTSPTPYKQAPAIVAGAQPGLNTLYFEVTETTGGVPAANNGSGVIAHMILTYEIPGQSSWTQMVCSDDSVYWIDQFGVRHDSLPTGISIVPCGSSTSPLMLCDDNGRFLRHIGYVGDQIMVKDTDLNGQDYVSVGTVHDCATSGDSAVLTGARHLTGDTAVVNLKTEHPGLQSVTITVVTGPVTTTLSDGTAVTLPAGTSSTWSVNDNDDSSLSAAQFDGGVGSDYLLVFTYKANASG